MDKEASKSLIYEFESVLAYVYGEITVQNKLTSSTWSPFYTCINLAGARPYKVIGLLRSMVLVKREIHGMGGNLANNAETDLHICF